MPAGSSPLPFLSCRYNSTFEEKSKQAANGIKVYALVGGAAAVGAGLVILAPEAAVLVGRGSVWAAPKLEPLKTLLKNTIRIGGGRVSLGPAPTHYNELGTIGKIFAPIHIHVELSKIWVDLNWLKVGFPLYKFDWIRKIF
jgi:hypothetical protein